MSSDEIRYPPDSMF